MKNGFDIDMYGKLLGECTTYYKTSISFPIFRHNSTKVGYNFRWSLMKEGRSFDRNFSSDIIANQEASMTLTSLFRFQNNI